MTKLGRISEYKAFLKEFRSTFHTTGAVLPSGRALARAVTRPLANHDRPIRVLEVGPGTGAVTREIVRFIGPDDHLDVVELNERFVEVLKHRFANEPSFKKVAEQTNVLHMAVQDLHPDEPYDFIISGLPVNNFSSGLVREILRHLVTLVKPGGTLSFFEYLGIRRIKTMIASPNERVRLAKVGRVLRRYLKQYEFQCDNVWVNFPPALAHHLRLDAPHVSE